MKGVSDEENVREAYRPLTKREREILELLLTVDVEGIEELRDQVSHVRGARWNCGCASFNLIVDKSKAPPSTITKSPLSEASSREPDDPDRYYELLLWVTEGWLSGVEIVDYVERHGEQSPQEIPPPDYWDTPRLVHVTSPPA
jgi:hypothetical protein